MRIHRAAILAFAAIAISISYAYAADQAQALHLLNRITYGPSPYSMAQVQSMGLTAYIEQQLHPEQIQDAPELQQALDQLTILKMTLPEITNEYTLPEMKGEKPSPDEKKAERQKQKIIGDEMRDAKLLRAVYSQAQLQELMVDFWFNHFNVFENKEAVRVLMGTYERDAIRPYAMGKFRDLVEATAHHPAMLFYLDNWLNTDPNSRIANKRFSGLNENYAREIMELHTMGVNGGYTQQDVTQLARILTGWGFGFGKGETKAQKISEFGFDQRRHDFSNKILLGHTISSNGEQEVEQAIDILVNHPATAHHISYEIAQYFVADDPPESLVNAMAATFTGTGGDIRAVLSTMLYSKEFWDPKYYQNKFKPPLRYVVSSIRLSGVQVNAFDKVSNAIKDMGEPLYEYLTPDGYAATNERWLNSDALLRRINFARQVANGKFAQDDTTTRGIAPITSTNSMLAVFGNQFSANSRAAVDSAEKKLKPVLILSSPEFVYY